jgi:putative SOS response-associated peptidase YedK
MCNRYQRGDRHRIDKLFGARPLREYNDGPEIVHPREIGAVVRLVDGQRVVEPMTWGFPVVSRGKDNQLLKPKPVNNARFDKLGGFWKRWAQEPAQRCLIPAVRFAEAEGRTGHMTTTWLSVRDQEMFAWAGLWRDSDEWGRAIRAS